MCRNALKRQAQTARPVFDGRCCMVPTECRAFDYPVLRGVAHITLVYHRCIDHGDRHTTEVAGRHVALKLRVTPCPGGAAQLFMAQQESLRLVRLESRKQIKRDIPIGACSGAKHMRQETLVIVQRERCAANKNIRTGPSHAQRS